ncbi:hypothetical protein [Bradyrhizobium sp. URHD0069]|uniref:hypothetical protein n=1 Tax=Bradyrhizobium sp. URHD0069 TaxID=1380355 RepID=UPI0012DE6613
MSLKLFGGEGGRAMGMARKSPWLRSRLCARICAYQDDEPASPATVCAAMLRRQSRHRQSLPSMGIGSRAASSAHQHGPARLQVNSVPQPEQARRRESGFSNRFVMTRAEPIGQ